MNNNVPLLSLVIPSRNDNYGGDSRWRMEMALDYLAGNLVRLGRLDDVEVVVTDWGSKVPLHNEVVLSPDARKIVRYLIVKPSLAHQLESDSEFPVVLAQNVGIRRSRGAFIAQMDADILLIEAFLEKLFQFIEGTLDLGVPAARSLAVAQRRNLPWILAGGRPGVQQLEWVMARLGHKLLGERFDDIPYFGTGFILMHRDLWMECGGFDEALMYRGRMEIDLGTRVTRQHPCVLLNRAGMPVYHLAHYTVFHSAFLPRKNNPEKVNSMLHPNGSDWGLWRYSLEEYSYGHAATVPSGWQRRPSAFPWSVITLRIVCAILVIVGGDLLRKAVPARFHPIPDMVFWGIGRIRLLFQGQPPGQWPAILRDFWRERSQRRHPVRSAQLGTATPTNSSFPAAPIRPSADGQKHQLNSGDGDQSMTGDSKDQQ